MPAGGRLQPHPKTEVLRIMKESDILGVMA